MIALKGDAPLYPQFFLTRVVGSEDFPDVEILTLPAYPSAGVLPDMYELRRELSHLGHFLWGSTDFLYDSFDHPHCLLALQSLMTEPYERESLSYTPEAIETYAYEVYTTQPVPVMNSPLSGSTLSQLVATGAGSAFIVAVSTPDVGKILLYFGLLGDTRIVLGAADGISLALKQGLSHILLKWMGVPPTVANPRKRKNKGAAQ
jgi:hypothetical protein